MNVLADDPLTLAYHELRSPLGLIITSAHALAHDTPDPTIRARVAVMARAAERLLRTVSHVFEFARAGTLDEPALFVPADSLQDVTANLRALGANVQATVTPEAGALSLFGHRAAFEVIVQSLLNNATEHGDAGQPVWLRLSCENGSLALDVENALPAQPRTRGLGTGLHLCRRLAVHMNGQLEAEFRDGRFCARLLVPAG